MLPYLKNGSLPMSFHEGAGGERSFVDYLGGPYKTSQWSFKGRQRDHGGRDLE